MAGLTIRTICPVESGDTSVWPSPLHLSVLKGGNLSANDVKEHCETVPPKGVVGRPSRWPTIIKLTTNCRLVNPFRGWLEGWLAEYRYSYAIKN